jgi:ABC-type branched-subunit amino acid transport system substrate-binding protein
MNNVTAARDSATPFRNRSKLCRLAGGLALGLLLAAAPAGAQDASPSGTGGVTGDQIKQVLGLEGKDAKALGTGLHFKLGIVLALTGPGSYYGRIQGNGAKLGVAQIKAAGGPDIELIFKDHKTADAQAGARATRELGIDGVPAILSSFVGDIGAMFPGVAQYKMLTLDGGGGTSDFGQRKPYFWGMRAIEPDDDFIELTTIGQTDYSATVSRLKASNPDAIFLFGTGVDPGYFMKQLVNAGMKTPVIGAEYISDAAKVAGPAFDNYMFATDWFNPEKPTNAWSKLFLQSYIKEFNLEPEINAANYYEDTFAIWDLIRRVIAKGGNVNSGEELQNALIADPKFQSVYGGSGTQLGTIELDTTTHTATKRPLGVYMSNNGKPKQVASFGIGGADFELTK